MLATEKSARAETGRSLPSLFCMGGKSQEGGTSKAWAGGDMLVLVSCQSSQNKGSTHL